MIEFLVYFSVCLLGFILMFWVLLLSLKKDKYPPNDDEDGGIGKGGNLPIIDLPPSGKIDDLLVDRWFEDKKHTINF